MDDKGKAGEVIIAVVYVIAIGLQVYIVADELTDGEFSRNLGVRITKTRAWLKQGIAREKAVRKDFGKVLWEATEVIENGKI